MSHESIHVSGSTSVTDPATRALSDEQATTNASLTTTVSYQEAVDQDFLELIEGIGHWGQTLPDGRVEWRLNADVPSDLLDSTQAEDQHRREITIAAEHRSGRVRP